ncbi:hypothetical protein EDB89DRAFT_1849268 [Lactarius sanguifluus]|nr:hypothetical protein EDB89DRAFT_1849268 [Lactarius sanguifluus]
MANLNRSAKSSSDWSIYDLNAYNIQTRQEDRATFFGDSNLPLPVIDEEIITTVSPETKNMLSDRNAELINLLYQTKWPGLAGESHAIDFTVELFRQLGYMKHSRIAHTQKRIPFLILSEWRDAKTDICLLNYPKHDILLLVLEEKHEPEGPWIDATAKLIAGAIAAFDYNNQLLRSRGENTKSKACASGFYNFIMPGIILHGTMPIFYKIPITTNLVHNVWSGTYPSEPTIVSFHVPKLPNPNDFRKGMEPPDSRRAILCCYEAFKHIIGI